MSNRRPILNKLTMVALGALALSAAMSSQASAGCDIATNDGKPCMSGREDSGGRPFGEFINQTANTMTFWGGSTPSKGQDLSSVINQTVDAVQGAAFLNSSGVANDEARLNAIAIKDTANAALAAENVPGFYGAGGNGGGQGLTGAKKADSRSSGTASATTTIAATAKGAPKVNLFGRDPARTTITMDASGHVTGITTDHRTKIAPAPKMVSMVATTQKSGPITPPVASAPKLPQVPIALPSATTIKAK
jgi:hypothetical protein